MPITINASVPNLTVTGAFTICKGDKKVYTASGANSYSWSTNASTASVSLNPTVTTSYTVTGTNTLNTCKSVNMFTITVNKCAGLDDFGSTASFFKVYPNPVYNNLILETDAKINLVIHNVTGKIVFEGVYKNGKYVIDMSDFCTGVYTIKASGELGTQTIRLIKSE
jgi:Secretion system C-terminal sorting domain